MLDHLIRKIGRKQAIEALIKIAYPDTTFSLTEATLSNWIDAQGLSTSAFFNKGRMRVFTHRRYIAWYHLNEMGMNLSEIGRMFGNRNHSTIINGIENHKNYTDTNDKEYAQIVQSFNDFFGLG
jgi:chromosomal replication initiation ATPase DnaA